MYDSAALLVSPMTSEISQIKSFLARYNVSCSRGDSAFVSFNSVSDTTIAAKSNGDPEVNSF